MAEIISKSLTLNDFKGKTWGNQVRIPSARLIDKVAELEAWVAQPELPGQVKMAWFKIAHPEEDDEMLLVAEFSHPEAAFAYKMRWA